jgi:hypothetical protein
MENIINNIPVQEPVSAPVVPVQIPNTEPVATWDLDENTKISGNRPDWLPDNFKNAKAVVDSYKELHSKFGSSYGAPEEYKWSNEGGNEPDGVKLFKQVAKEQNLSQSAFDNIVNSYLDKETTILEAQKEAQKQVIANLGEDRINRMKNQVNNLGLTDELKNTLSNFVQGEKEFQLLETLLSKVNNIVNPIANINTPAVDYNKELKDIYNNQDYRVNPAKYHDRVIQLTKMKLGN